jgi:hypothetical protein
MLARTSLVASICGWLLCVGLAAVPAVRHQFTPGAATDVGAWPASSALHRSPSGPTLVLVAHARCPCVWASLDELSLALAQAPQVRPCVLVVTPPGVQADAALAVRARQLPHAEVIADDGTEARRFGVSTSGHALLFDASGRLLFSGGLTASRGHRGDNAGLRAVIALAQGGAPAETSAPVYGCALADPLEGACARCARPVTR